MSGSIETNSLFLGLTRPPMLFGVSYTLATVNLMFSLLTFIITTKLIYILVVLPTLHFAFWMICLKEPRAMELLKTRYSKCSLCRNRMRHGSTNSYDVF